MGLEHLRILVSAGVLEPILHGYQGTPEDFRESKVTHGVLTVQESVPLTPMLRASGNYGEKDSENMKHRSG